MYDYAELLTKRAQAGQPQRSKTAPVVVAFDGIDEDRTALNGATMRLAAARRALDSYDSQPDKPARKLNSPNPRTQLVEAVEEAERDVETAEAAIAERCVYLRLAYPTVAQHTRAVTAANGNPAEVMFELVRECLLRVEDSTGAVVEVPTEVMVATLRSLPSSELGKLGEAVNDIVSPAAFPTKPGR